MFANLTRLIQQETRLAVPASSLTPRANLFALGMNAFDAIRLLVAIERSYKIEFPRETLKRETMATIENITAAIRAARPAPAAMFKARLAA